MIRLFTTLAALCLASVACAAYPEKPIRFSKRETVKWAEVVKRAGVKAD